MDKIVRSNYNFSLSYNIFVFSKHSEYLLEKVEAGQVFARDEEISWQCRNCGHVHYGKEAPKACPTCAHPQAYFEEEKQNF